MQTAAAELNPGPAPARRPISALRPSRRARLEGGLGSVRMRVAGAGAGPLVPGGSCGAGGGGHCARELAVLQVWDGLGVG